jgi:two-component sensor histidine kinase
MDAGLASPKGRRSFRARLLALSIGVLLPAVACTAWLLWSQSVENARRYQQQQLGTARALSTAIDHKIAEITAVGQTLATSTHIPARQFGLFRERTLEALKGRPGWVVLADSGGRQRVNTRFPIGTSLPPGRAPANVALAAAGGRSRISDLAIGRIVQRPIIAVDTPIRTPSGAFNLSYIVEPTVFLPLFEGQKLPPGWIVTLLDRQLKVIARSSGHDRFVGRPASPDIRSALGRAQEGVVRSRSFEGEPVTVAFSRSAATGWTLLVAAPEAEMRAETSRAMGRAALLSVALLLVSLALAWLLSRGLSRQVAALVSDASALAEGGAVAPREGLMAELSAIQGAIERASHDLAARERRHQLMVNELNHRVRNTLATVQALAAHTFRGARLPPELEASFGGRLQALAAAHDLLSEVNWSRTTLAETLKRCLPLADGRIAAHGPAVELSSQAGVALCMIFHELITNSLKYGSLSAPEGRVTITWSSTGQTCRLVWTESGGPEAAPPARKGFGTRLIERLLKQDMDGSCAFDFRPQGLVFTAEFSTARQGRWDAEVHVEGGAPPPAER